MQSAQDFDQMQRMIEPDASEELLREGWAALPAEYRIPDQAPTLEEARAWCKHLAETHYENFHVASWFLPKALRPHFHAIYAYCRVSDDLGDETGNDERARAQSLALLQQWREELDACYEGKARHPVFVVLAETIRACQIPKEPFADLLAAFVQDQTVARYADRTEVLEYCRCSANPVGRLVLYTCGYTDAERFRLSDATCSALQLANFWQDVSSDYHLRGRIYIPQDAMRRFGVDEQSIAQTIAAGKAAPEFRALLKEQVDWARQLFEEGLPLIGMVDRELALDLDLFSRGGLEILRAIEARDYDVLSARPAISKTTKIGLALRALSGKLLPGLRLKARAA
jgi:squalene synthase HpnC